MAIIPGAAIDNDDGKQITVGGFSRQGGLSAFSVLNQKMECVFQTHFGQMQHYKPFGESWLWKPDFYDCRFPRFQGWWNEFDAVTKKEVQNANWNEPKWIFENAELIYEIYTPCLCPAKIGTHEEDERVKGQKRWTFANLRYFGGLCEYLGRTTEYAFLGLYEFDAEKSTLPYKVDSSFPGEAIAKAMETWNEFDQNQPQWVDFKDALKSWNQEVIYLSPTNRKKEWSKRLGVFKKSNKFIVVQNLEIFEFYGNMNGNFDNAWNQFVSYIQSKGKFSQSDIDNIQKGLITYPHRVWKRVQTDEKGLDISWNAFKAVGNEGENV